MDAVEPAEAASGSRVALLVIDPVNDFLSSEGAAWELTKGTVEINEVVPNLKRLIEGARSRAVPVLFGPMAYTQEDYADEKWQERSGINRIMFERKFPEAMNLFKRNRVHDFRSFTVSMTRAPSRPRTECPIRYTACRSVQSDPVTREVFRPMVWPPGSRVWTDVIRCIGETVSNGKAQK